MTDKQRQAAKDAFDDHFADDDAELPGDDVPPAGFNPDRDYDDGDGDGSSAGDESDDIEDESDDDDGASDGDAADDEVDPDTDSDDEADAGEADDEATDEADDNSGEEEDDGTEGSASNPVAIDDTELDTHVQFAGMDKPMTLRELRDSIGAVTDTQAIQAQRSELQAQQQQVQATIQQAEQVLATKTQDAQVFEVPHLFLDGYVKDMVAAGALPQEAYNDFAQLMKDYAETGRYNAQSLVTNLQSRLQSEAATKQAQEQRTKAYEDQAKLDIAQIEKTDKVVFDEKLRQQLGTYIREYAAHNGGTLLRVSTAYQLLKADGKIVAPSKAPTSKKKLAKQLRKKAAKGKPPGSRPGASGSAADSRKRKDAAAAFRALQGD